MTTRFTALTTPSAGADWQQETGHRRIGFLLATVGLMLAVGTLVANLVAASDIGSSLATLRLSFGLTTLAFGTIKLAIAVILVGILVNLWHRVESVQHSLSRLAAGGTGESNATGPIKTAYGAADVTRSVPQSLPIHKIAQKMWLPMLVMGATALVAGTIVSFAWAGSETDVALGAWTQGLQFLGETMLLSGLAFLLGAILASLREGGGKVQESLALPVLTLKMPKSAKLFVGLLMLGLLLGVLQFILYVAVAGGVSDAAPWLAWLGPVRELALGLILAGIVMALVTIGNVLGFQFSRIRQIIAAAQ